MTQTMAGGLNGLASATARAMALADGLFEAGVRLLNHP
jgi:hypothetical protein